MTQFRLIGSLDAIAVELTRRNTSHPNMPDVTSPMTRGIQINAPGRMRVTRILIEFQVNTRRVAAEQDKINSVSGLMRASNRQRVSRQNLTLQERPLQRVRSILFDGHFTHRTPIRKLITLLPVRIPCISNPATDQGSAPLDFGIANTFVQWTRSLVSGLTF